MTDICKCSNYECGLRSKCWRTLAPDDNWQTYFKFEPEANSACEHFWDRYGDVSDDIKAAMNELFKKRKGGHNNA